MFGWLLDFFPSTFNDYLPLHVCLQATKSQIKYKNMIIYGFQRIAIHSPIV